MFEAANFIVIGTEQKKVNARNDSRTSNRGEFDTHLNITTKTSYIYLG